MVVLFMVFVQGLGVLVVLNETTQPQGRTLPLLLTVMLMVMMVDIVWEVICLFAY
jgi:hypothetical protein